MSAPEEAVSLQVTCIALWGTCWLQTTSVETASERKEAAADGKINLSTTMGEISPPSPPGGVGLCCSLLGEGRRGRLERSAEDGMGKES